MILDLHMALESRDSFLDSLKNRIVELENLLMKKVLILPFMKNLLILIIVTRWFFNFLLGCHDYGTKKVIEIR